MLVAGGPCQPSVMFTGKAEGRPKRRAPKRYAVWVGSDLNPNIKQDGKWGATALSITTFSITMIAIMLSKIILSVAFLFLCCVSLC